MRGDDRGGGTQRDVASDATRKAVTSTGPLNDGCPGTVDGNGIAPIDAPHLRTRAVHAGEDIGAAVRPLTRPIVQSSVYAFRDPAMAEARFAADPPEPNYSRDGLPNVRALARAVADLEGAEAGHAAASGMAAIGLLFLAHLSAGDHVVISADCYRDTQLLLTEELARFGVVTSRANCCDPIRIERAVTPRTRLIYVDTISNPAMKLADLPRVAAIAHAAGALLAVDNTFATPVLCRPIEHGADLVVHSATKFLGGHHDLTAGVIVGRRDLIAPIERCGYRFGPTLGSFDAWLALRGIKTLAPRMAWITETALTLATFLQTQRAIAAVRYPGLPDHPQPDLVRRLLPEGAGGVLAFDLRGGPAAADAFIRNLRLIPYAMSLGGATTTVSYPPRWRTAGAPVEPAGCATVRMSVGLEAARDLIADLRRALDGLPDDGTAPKEDA